MVVTEVNAVTMGFTSETTVRSSSAQTVTPTNSRAPRAHVTPPTTGIAAVDITTTGISVTSTSWITELEFPMVMVTGVVMVMPVVSMVAGLVGMVMV